MRPSDRPHPRLEDRMPRNHRAPLLPLLLALACGGAEVTSDSATEAGSTGGSTGAAACGDGQIGDGEVCDGAALGDAQCSDLDPSLAGALACAADCMSFDMSGCAVDPNAPKIVLNEVTSRGLLEGPILGDAIELYNAGGGAADLSGWKLSDDPTFPADKTYVFPAGKTLAPGAYLVLVEIDPDTSAGDLPFGISASKEETLTLADAADHTLDALIVDGPDAVVSYCRLPDGTGAWQRCDWTFGAANEAASTLCGDAVRNGDEQCDGADLAGNTCAGLGFAGGDLGCSGACLLDPSSCTSDSLVVLNEVESTDDRIELYNAGDEPVDLSGWILTDAPLVDYSAAADLEKLTFPAGASIAPGEFLVIAKGNTPNEHPFGLAIPGDTITLRDPDLVPVSAAAYGPDQAVLSYCRVPDGPDGAWFPDCAPTFGAANNKPMP